MEQQRQFVLTGTTWKDLPSALGKEQGRKSAEGSLKVDSCIALRELCVLHFY